MTEKLELPTKVVNADWKDDIDYTPYEDEMNYIPPEKVENATAE